MDVEKTIHFLLEQEAVFASRMDELAIRMGELATNLVAIGKAQSRFDQQQQRLQDMQVNQEERIQRLEEAEERTTKTIDALGRHIDQLVDLMRGGFETNGSGS